MITEDLIRFYLPALYHYLVVNNLVPQFLLGANMRSKNMEIWKFYVKNDPVGAISWNINWANYADRFPQYPVDWGHHYMIFSQHYNEYSKIGIFTFKKIKLI